MGSDDRPGADTLHRFSYYVYHFCYAQIAHFVPQSGVRDACAR